MYATRYLFIFGLAASDKFLIGLLDHFKEGWLVLHFLAINDERFVTDNIFDVLAGNSLFQIAFSVVT